MQTIIRKSAVALGLAAFVLTQSGAPTLAQEEPTIQETNSTKQNDGTIIRTHVNADGTVTVTVEDANGRVISKIITTPGKSPFGKTGDCPANTWC